MATTKEHQMTDQTAHPLSTAGSLGTLDMLIEFCHTHGPVTIETLTNLRQQTLNKHLQACQTHNTTPQDPTQQPTNTNTETDVN